MEETTSFSVSPYAGRTFALLTQHGKEQVVSPILRDRLDVGVQLISSFDTDSFGTFTREVPRHGSQLEAARAKARKAIEIAGCPYGLGSEGSFSPEIFGLGTANVEFLILLDDDREIEIAGRAHGVGVFHHGRVSDDSQLEVFALMAGFPEHSLVLRPSNEFDTRITKGIQTWQELEAAFAKAKQLSVGGVVFVENDLCAHMNPSRMRTIQTAARDLAERISQHCEKCQCPGFGLVRKLSGLPCRDCGDPTLVPIADVLACVRCGHTESRAISATAADPAHCDSCNP